jgi:myo-inositol 2-dehydrogenase/D-chiro-inositol 1-dehydrogenase
MDKPNKVNVGIIGAGRIGRVHGENLAYRIPNARLVAVADVIEQAAAELAANLHIPSVYSDAEAIMADKNVDAVVICSSTDTHAQLIQAAAAAKKHIFCEKPIALDIARIDHALAEVDRAGVKLQIGFNRRFDPSFKRIRELVASGALGQPHILRITSRDPAPPPLAYVKVSGGIFLDMTIHDFDMARYLLGSEVEEVFAAGSVLVDPEIGQAGDIDTAVTTLRFSTGALGVIDNSRKAVYGYDQRIEVFGSGGMAQATNAIADNVAQSDTGGVHTSLPLHFFVERYAQAYVEEMRAFVQCILQDQPSVVSGVDGRIPVIIGYAALKSFKENRPVRLSEVDRK